MLVECAWCKRIVGVKSDEGYDGPLTSPTSGICPDCLQKHFPAAAEEIAARKQPAI